MREPVALLLTEPQDFPPTCPGNPVHWLWRSSLVTYLESVASAMST